MSQYLTISANFRAGASLPTIEEHYESLWRLAKFLETINVPLDEWFPPADTEANSRLNKAFSDGGPSTAAIAMAKADKANLASDLRNLGVWNGTEGEGGMAFTTTLDTGYIPSNLDFSSKGIAALKDYRNVVKLVQTIIAIWRPMLVQVDPDDYSDKKIFPDRPSAGWMIYLPYTVMAAQVPEAAHVIPIMDDKGKKQQGTLIVTVADTFDVNAPEHVKKANAIETRLVDQDLLPTLREFVTKF
ncbi:Immunity protein 52 [Duganella sacchari]|uniref:Immunity protein 52 n=1 Tax=Duganella sacchari TaxID=551987 RepID=A0A1M7RC14_9BURK|nr:Imm52 family immunity protein [Duganella sacchari]SHN43679.1 Immunity protein 52 [Duganella sacchari]